MAPTTYGDLGKSARDVFGKGYHFSLMKLELKTKTASGVEFTSSKLKHIDNNTQGFIFPGLNKDIITSWNIFCLGGSSNTDSGKVDGSLETKYKFAEYGTTFTEKWNTNNQLSTTIDVQDKILKGLKLTFDSEFSPQVIFIFTFMSSTCRLSSPFLPTNIYIY